MEEGCGGQCFCGAVRYRMRGQPMFVYCCHCTDCQKQTGSAYVINAQIETERIDLIAGEPVAASMTTESGYPHDIFRCQTCLTAVWSDYGRRGWLRFIRIVTLDRPGDFPPAAHIYTRSKLPWVSLDDGVPAFEEYYDMPTFWKPENYARREAARIKAGAAR